MKTQLATAGLPSVGVILVVPISTVDSASWSSTKLSDQQGKALERSLREYGLLDLIIVRETSGRYETIDGGKRLSIARSCGQLTVNVLNVGPLSDAEAREMHLALNLNRGRPDATRLADAIEAVIEAPATEALKVRKELELGELLPLRGGAAKAVKTLRTKGQKTRRPPGSGPSVASFIEYKFAVDPAAATVCDQALGDVQRKTGVKKNVAFEYICADYNQSVKAHGGSYGK